MCSCDDIRTCEGAGATWDDAQSAAHDYWKATKGITKQTWDQVGGQAGSLTTKHARTHTHTLPAYLHRPAALALFSMHSVCMNPGGALLGD